MALPPLAQIVDLETMAQYADASAVVADKSCPALAGKYRAAATRARAPREGMAMTDLFKSEEDIIEEVRQTILTINKAWTSAGCKTATSGGGYTTEAPLETIAATQQAAPDTKSGVGVPGWLIAVGVGIVAFVFWRKKPKTNKRNRRRR